jgi:GT2 family glycosyltransferase
MAKQIDLNIIILTYNSQFWLKKTLSTLKEFYLDSTKKNVEVTVVDNNSDDDTVALIGRSFRWVNLIKQGTNAGFAAGNNVALSQTSARYAMLMNSDMECVEDSNFDVLIDYMDSNPAAGMVTPRIEFTNGHIDPASHRGEPTLWASFTYFAKLEALMPHTKRFGQYHQYYKDLSSVHTIDACSGAAMMVRMEAVEKVGLLDERFFMYAEDLDWCKRFRDVGYKIIYHPSAKIIHHKYKSGIKSASKKIATQTSKHFYDTMLQYYDKHYQKQYPQFVRTLIRYFLAVKKEGA